MRDTKHKLSPLTTALHWFVGLTIMTLLAMGVYMDSYEVYALYDIHKSIGIIIVAFVLLRIIWRALNGWPEPVSQHSGIEYRMAKLVHWALITGTVVLPVSGMLMSVGGGHGLSIFGLELLSENVIPDNPQMAVPLNETLAQTGKCLHGIVGNVMIAAIVLHVIGALKHHIVNKDGTLHRMLGGRL